MNNAHILKVDSLNYHIGEKHILRDIYLSAKTGDILSIRGRNGAGKSTLLNILFGTIKADYIYISIDGKVITNRQQLNKHICYKPQFNFFPKHLKVKDVLMAKDIEDIPLHNHLNSKIDELSTGEQQLVQTLYVLNLPQPICLLDEPFSGISPILQEFITNIIKEKAKSKIIILTDHHTDLINAIATQIVELDNGYFKRI
ncbi:MAG: ATP-binding cassette domain-containing protein [Flavobacteriaceae bacterium]|jgi:ABC-type multidrug transport system ATPase subunit|nr:ATP-binding cassette domain-containing protein [Flavobacteriaceae bacterium]